MRLALSLVMSFVIAGCGQRAEKLPGPCPTGICGAGGSGSGPSSGSGSGPSGSGPGPSASSGGGCVESWTCTPWLKGSGQKYQVAVKLVGEHLGLSGCGQYLTHTNNFAAAFEDASGKPTGVLASDSGQSAASGPTALPKPINGTTVLYGDCHAVTSSGGENLGAWSFSWTAPASGSGAVRLFYGAVDGSCDMMSMGDDVKVGTLQLGEATAMAAPPRGSGLGRLAALLAFLPVGLVMSKRRRRRRAARAETSGIE